MAAFGVSDEGHPTEDALATLPVLVNAGADREVLRGYNTFLDGSGSTHPQGLSFAVTWRQVAGEAVYFSKNVLMPTFVAPLDEQSLVFELSADDGRSVTRDEVRLDVKKDPRRLAPRVSAGPDRFLDVTQKPEPNMADVDDANPTTISYWWKAVGFDTSQVVGEAPSVWRLTTEREGLHSAPDYLILFPYSPDRIGNQAPNLPNVSAQQVAFPGEELTFDASKTNDPNGDPVRFRWVQTRGMPILPEDRGGPRLTVTAPRRKEEISFRVFARDEILESVGTEVSVVVGADVIDLLPPVNPGPDRRTRPGRQVTIDALNGVQWSDQETSFAWMQTYGAPVSHSEAVSDGRFFAFVAPDGVGDLAFAVHATNNELEGVPSVVKVSVVGDADNQGPTVFLTSIVEEGAVRVVARSSDPEGDAIVGCEWSAHKEPDGYAVEMPSCSLGADGSAELFVEEFTETTLVVTHASWDELGDEGHSSIELQH